MKIQIIKIFSFWAIFSLLVHAVVENVSTAPSSLSNIQMQKPPVVKIKTGKNLLIGSSTKSKRFAMK